MADRGQASDGAPVPQQQPEAQDLTVFVQQLLQQMQSRFQAMSDAIINKIDEMGTRIDDLERSIADLQTAPAAASAQGAPGQR